MIDMIFYHEKYIYVYYNMHSHLKLSGYYSDHPNLCKSWDKVEEGPIFASFTDDLLDENSDGNEYVVV